MKKTIFFLILLALSACHFKKEKKIQNKTRYEFSGNEPFWTVVISDNTFTYCCAGDSSYKERIEFSDSTASGVSFGFKGDSTYGIINANGICQLDVTEDDSIFNHEIYFSFRNKTYKGCGKLINQ